MAVIINLDDVERIREQIARAHALTAERFRDAFAAQSDIPPNERWRVHLEIQAAALLETARDVRVAGRIRYDIVGRIVTPRHARFTIERTPEALLEYWMLSSELLASAGWRMTKLLATPAEYNDALRGMQQPQLVCALVASFLPAGEWHADGTALLEVTLYTRAEEERIERRHLGLDANQELHFHSRELIAEGRGGVPAT
ncbi:MAG TPA: hypothetical protein VMU84_12355 [Thermoanaerobaculia bacterium]|nr:hypothetical protein [Thermoanaerobaculia bacterium]